MITPRIANQNSFYHERIKRLFEFIFYFESYTKCFFIAAAENWPFIAQKTITKYKIYAPIKNQAMAMQYGPPSAMRCSCLAVIGCGLWWNTRADKNQVRGANKSRDSLSVVIVYRQFVPIWTLRAAASGVFWNAKISESVKLVNYSSNRSRCSCDWQLAVGKYESQRERSAPLSLAFSRDCYRARSLEGDTIWVEYP